ncbi:MAG: ATP-binding protein [Kofleriaceae bacterium]
MSSRAARGTGAAPATALAALAGGVAAAGAVLAAGGHGTWPLATVAGGAVAGICFAGVAVARRRAAAELGGRAQAVILGEPALAVAVDDASEAWIGHLAAEADRMRQDLARERALAALVLDSLGQGVIALDDELRIVQVNAAARGLLGLASSPIGEALIDVVRAPALLALIEADPSDDTAEIQMSPGHRVLARVTTPARGGGRVVTLEDVTAMRRLETVRRDFVANVSHELRTPVSVIRANAETLMGGAKDDPAMRGRLIDGLHRNAERLARILADLLDLSRLDAGQYRVELAELPLADAVTSAVGVVEARARERETALSTTVGADVRVVADGKALDQILINLIDNAIKYTPPGGHVQISAAPAAGARVRIEVVDDGPGIAPNHIDRVFERFYRVDAGRAREAGGTGLGLAISKHLVESMGGEIGVTPNQPHGTRFWFELPAAPAPMGNVAVV